MAADTVVPLGNAEVLTRFHPGARVEVRPICAHASMAQEPDAVAEAVLAATLA
jgi:pimeloyl-ACP methyl ester carboxylesterase